MIDSREVRIGNLVLISNGDVAMVNGIHYAGMKDEEYEIHCLYDNKIYFDPSPIPLTEEWLLKAGFEKKNKEKKFDFGWMYIEYKALESDDWVEDMELGHQVRIYVNTESYKCSIENITDKDEMGANTKTDIKYVHQLQNLYFALTGEELNFNL